MFSKKFMSKLVATVLTVGTLMPATFATTQFSDVTDAKYSNYVDAINFMSGLGIMVGSTDKADDTKVKFGPDDNVTRAQVAKILDLALGYGKIVDSATAAKFPDVKADNWAAKYIAVANEKGLIKGSTSGKFSPEGNVTYAQYATMALRALGYKDADLEGTWPFNFLSKATDLGLFNNLDTVAYDKAAPRKDIAVMTQNLLFTATKADLENNVYVYDGSATEETKNVNHVGNNLAYRPKWLIDTVKKVIGVDHVSGVVVSDKTVEPTLGDKITVSTGLGKDDTTTNLNAADSKDSYSLSVPDSAKKDYTLGSKVSFWYSTNVATKNNIIYDTKAEDKKVADAYVTALPSSKTTAFETMVDPSSTTETSVKDKSFGANAYLILNGRYWNNISSIDATDFAGTKKGLLKYAKVKLFDYNDDKKIDFAVIDQELKPLVVQKDYAAADKGVVVYEAWTKDATDDTKVDLSTDGITVTVTGAVSKVEDIRANDVIYVKRSADNKLVNIDVVRTVVDGKVIGTERNNDAIAATLTTPAVPATMKNITVGTSTYNVDEAVKSTQLNLNDNVKFLMGKSTVDDPKHNKVVKYVTLGVGSIDLSNYGVVTAATDNGKDIYGNILRYVKFNPLTTTSRDIVVNQATYDYVSTKVGGVFKFDPSVAVTGNDLQFLGTDKAGSNLTNNYLYGYLVSGTRVFATDTLGNVAEKNAAQIDIMKEAYNTNNTVTNRVYGIMNVDPRLYGMTAQGYAGIVVVNPSTYGYYGDKTGQGIFKNLGQYKEELYYGVNTRLYDVAIDGVDQTIRVKSDIVSQIPAKGYFNKLFYDANGVVVGVNAVNADVPNAKVLSIANGQLMLASGSVYNAINAKVYDKDGKAVSLDYLAAYYMANYKNVIVDVELAYGYYNTVAFIKIVDLNNNAN